MSIEGNTGEGGVGENEPPQLTPEEFSIIEALSPKPCPIEELLDVLNLEPPQVNNALGKLQRLGLVDGPLKRDDTDYYTLTPKGATESITLYRKREKEQFRELQIRILEAVKLGLITLKTIAVRLGEKPTTVAKHLKYFYDSGFVTRDKIFPQTGRPYYEYQITEAGKNWLTQQQQG